MTEEKRLPYANGFVCMGLIIAVWLVTVVTSATHSPLAIIFGFFSVLSVIALTGIFVNQPNEAQVVTFFGSYIGTAKEPGFFFTYPLTTKNEISLKVVNIHTDKTKVNDAKGNPIEIAAVIVWKVSNPFKAYFGVNNYREFIGTQADAVIRTIATHYPYDAHDEQVDSLKGSLDTISQVLQKMLQERLEVAGIEVMEARLSDLSYAPEIAQSMLRRQQAEAQIAARKYIVENAVTMVEQVLDRLEQNKITLEGPQKVQMINNLLVALVSEHDTSPVINIGQG